MWVLGLVFGIIILCATQLLVVYHLTDFLHQTLPVAELRALLQRLGLSEAERIAAPVPLPLPEPLQDWLAAESEPWAAEDLAARARELYAELDDGDAGSTWAKVLQRLQQEEGVSG